MRVHREVTLPKRKIGKPKGRKKRIEKRKYEMRAIPRASCPPSPDGCDGRERLD